jgi:hypothetical protein
LFDFQKPSFYKAFGEGFSMAPILPIVKRQNKFARVAGEGKRPDEYTIVSN